MSIQVDPKRLAGEKAAEFVRDGMTLGLGTGSTVSWTVRRLGELVRDGLRIRGIPTSRRTEQLARECGIPLVGFADVQDLDLAIDGADEINPSFDLIKGGGGALLREKLVASAARRFVVVADSSKPVPVLGTFALPIEVVPFAWELTIRRIADLGCTPRLRQVDGKPFLTDNGSFVVDGAFGRIPDPGGLNQALKMLVGVVETGLFVGMTDAIVIGSATGVEVQSRPRPGG